MDITKKYQKLSPIQHVLKRPGMYIGGVDEVDQDVWIFEEKEDKIIEKNIKFSPGLYKIFDEIIVNAYDQTIRDPTVTTIKVDIDEEKNQITVFNNGKGIDVVIHPKEKIYVPELIFAHLRTSTTFAEEEGRITGGVHGLGAKLTAIFSSYFKVEVGDPVNKKKFSQFYKNNLSSISKPVVGDYAKGDGYVKITFVPDLKYFKLNDLSQDLVALMKRRVYDLTTLTKKDVKVYLNGNRIQQDTFEKYVSLFTDAPQIKEMCDPTSIKFDEGRWKILVTKSDGNYKQISFVNGIYTMNGGKHVDYIVTRVVKDLVEYAQKKFKSPNIKPQFIRDQLWFFIVSVVEDATFSSQTKDELVTPVSKFGSTCVIPDSLTRKIYTKFSLDTVISQYVKFAESVALGKLDVKKTKTVKGIKKLYDANFAGTTKSNLCTLILTEGDSAKTMAISGLSAIPKGNNTYGVFPLRGKLLNVRDATHSQIVKNEEFINLKKILGLQTGKRYDNDSVKELRYGSILLMMDADVDGSHIKGLFINLIHHFWPSLIKIDGFIKVFITPVVKATAKSLAKSQTKSKSKEVISFYTLDDYEKWKKKTDVQKWFIKYYKGLGANTTDEAKEYFMDLEKHVVQFNYVESTDGAIQLAFSKDKADERKMWLKKYDPDETLDFTQKLFTYKDFIHKELKHFSNYDNIRSIPSIMDGLKPSQRKVIYAAFKRNLAQEVKVAQFVGYISEHSSYHHGETSLANTVIGMAQNYLGSNNINLLVPNGQFGTRLQGGKDHSSPRYIYTKLRELTRLIFHKDDDPLLNYLDDDGFPIEPEYYVPVIPMILVNGTDGIGTGYSTFIPKYNPLDIIDNLEKKLSGQNFVPMAPWYNGFNGSIVKKEATVYLTKGKYTIDKNVLTIDELPVTSWTEAYKIFLETSIGPLKNIRNIRNNSTESTVEFTIRFDDENSLKTLEKRVDKHINGIEKMFYLTRVINLGNMHLYSPDNIIKRYPSPQAILMEYYVIRLEYYKRRKEYLLKKLEDEIKILKSKVKFIQLVVDKKIVLFNKGKEQIIKILKGQNLLLLPDEPPFDYLIKMSFYSLTKEKIDELKALLKKKTNEYNILKNKKIEQMWLDDLNAIKTALQ